MSTPPRFECRTGRFGCYMYDTANQTEVDLATTVKYLNAYGEYLKQDITDMITGLDHGSANLETLAATQHAIWSHWMDYLFTKIIKAPYSNSDGYKGYMILQEDLLRWKHQMETPYTDLSEAEKESDRQIMRRFVLQEEM